MIELALKHGLSFADLHDREGLIRLDRAFIAHLAETDGGLHNRLVTARRNPGAVERLDESDLLVDLALTSRTSSASFSGSKPRSGSCRRGITSWRRFIR
jgi:hypothetical protein